MTVLDQDPEIQAIQAVAAGLGPLSPAARQRVLAWAMDRYGLEDEDEPAQRPGALLARQQPPAPALPRHVRPMTDYPNGFGER